MSRCLRIICVGLTVGFFSLPGCGESQPETPTSAASTPAAPPEQTVKIKGRGKKNVDPTADMSLSELREYKKQQREAGGPKTP